MNLKERLFKIGSKIRRSFDILIDKSEIHKEYPFYKFFIINQILKDKY